MIYLKDDIYLFEKNLKYDGNLFKVRDELVKFLIHWLIEHIVEEDKLYAEYYHQLINVKSYY